MKLSLEIPKKIGNVLRTNKTFKVLYGGRGSAKSWSVARMLLVKGISKPLRIMCARELQISLSDSVHKLLSDQITNLGLEDYYEIQKATIIGRKGTAAEGTEFLFSGIKNAKNIKSFEGIDILWIEEAQTVSYDSWELVIPTVRKKGSEIWVTFNPEYDDDDTYKRFVIDGADDDDISIAKVNYYDNPWFHESTMPTAMRKSKAKNISAYMHVWEGECITETEGAVYNLSWFPRYRNLPGNTTMIVHSWDTAYKADQHNDPYCCTIWHVTPSTFVLADVIHGRAEYPELRKLVFDTCNNGTAYSPGKPDAVLIEDKASGQSLIQELQRSTTHPVIAILPDGDKETRARTTSASCEAGNVLFPQDAPWLSAFEREIMLFPPPHGSKIHDDRVDSMSQFLRYMIDNNPSSYEQTMRELGYI